MAKVLKTIGQIAGVVALVAGTLGTLGVGGPAAAAVFTKIATYSGPPSDREAVGFKTWEDEMTLQNGFVCGSRVNLYCDTAWLKMPGGTVGEFYPKAIEGKRWPYAITTTYLGNPEINQLAARLDLEDPANPADLIEALHGILVDYRSRHPESVARFLAGSWDGQRARMHVLATDDLGFTPPLKPVELTAYVSSGNRSTAYRLASDKGWTQARMLSVIDAQRVEPFASPIHAPLHAVGGNAIEVVVSRKGVRTSIVRQWHDEIGKPIEPVVV